MWSGSVSRAAPGVAAVIGVRLDEGDGLVLGDEVADGYRERAHDARAVRHDDVMHLHCLEDGDLGALGDHVAFSRHDCHDDALHRGAQRDALGLHLDLNR